MNEKGTKKREWVKTAAIVFLSVLLVLTFFSNTIMNYSLPEVAAQYIQPGTITAKVRGTGTIESGDPYKIQINESRKVESVLVKAGDEVQQGDILFILADMESKELTEAEDALDAAILEFEKAILAGDISNGVINNVQNGNVASVATYQSKILAAETQIQNWEKKVAEIQGKINELTTAINKLGFSGSDTTEEAKGLFNAQTAYDNKNAELTQAKAALTSLQGDLAAAQKTVLDYQSGILSVSGGDAEAEYNAALLKTQKLPEQITAAQNRVTEIQTQTYALSVEVDKAQARLDAKKGNTGSINSYKIELENWNLEMNDKKAKHDEAKSAKEQLLADIAKELSLDAQTDIISKKREEVAKLRSQAVGAVIEAPVAGKISEVSITAGQETVAGTPIATMQPEGKGYTMSFSVTNEQAKKLSVGVKAELVNAWRYEDIEVTLTGMKPDPADPGKKKILTFNVNGSVAAGQSLNVSIGDKSANYDMIVPNSAIREDNNGKFILIVESKSSPLGNRYIATRMDVEVVASDDTQSAVAGGLYGYEFVITTSNKPVEAGKQVRLAEG